MHRILIYPKKKHEVYDLFDTRQKLICPGCQGKARHDAFYVMKLVKNSEKHVRCAAVKVRQYVSNAQKLVILFVIKRLKIEWHTIYSITYPRNTFLPDGHIKEARNKQTAFNGDDECVDQSLESTFQHLLKEIDAKSPHNFAPFIKEQFSRHHSDKTDDSTRIRRIKCIIHKLDIMEIDYQCGTLQNTKNARKGTYKLFDASYPPIFASIASSFFIRS